MKRPHDLRGRPVEETGVVEMGTTPGARAGWECAACNTVTGLQFGSSGEAARSLAIHVESNCTAELP